jgi:hypothetical protein
VFIHMFTTFHLLFVIKNDVLNNSGKLHLFTVLYDHAFKVVC